MQKHFPIVLFTFVQALAACGGSKAPSALTGTAQAALSCETDFDCGAGYRCAGEAEHAYCEQSSVSSSAHACSNDADCSAGYVCPRDIVSPYCRPAPSKPPSNSADAGCVGEYCRNDRYGGGSGDDDRHEDGDSYYSSSSPCTPDAGAAGAGGTASGGGGNGDSYYSDGYGHDHGSEGDDGHGGPGRD
jgi:hypothetical protein